MRVNQVTGHTVWPFAQPLQDIVERFQEIYYAPDIGPLLVALGCYAAHRIKSQSAVWLMLAGGPSTGKTEIVNLFRNCDEYHSVGSINGEAGLLSATKLKERAKDATGGLLHRVGSSGFLCFKDFTSVLCGNKDTQAIVLKALREIYDGHWERDVGTDGGRLLSWDGRVGVIAACTTTIDKHRSVMAEMGDRFIYFRMPVFTAEEDERMAGKAFDMDDIEIDERSRTPQAEMAERVAEFFVDVPVDKPETPTEDYRDCVVGLANLIARCRSESNWDWKKEFIDDPQAPEGSSRIVRQLKSLDAGLNLIGVPEISRFKLIRRTALYSAPPLRLEVLNQISPGPQKPGAPLGKTAAEIKAKVPNSIASIYRAIQELAAQGMIRPGTNGAGAGNIATRWVMSDEWLDRWNRSPEGSIVSKEIGGVVEIPQKIAL